jgi:flagellar biosynthesis component FlhA
MFWDEIKQKIVHFTQGHVHDWKEKYKDTVPRMPPMFSKISILLSGLILHLPSSSLDFYFHIYGILKVFTTHFMYQQKNASLFLFPSPNTSPNQ